MIQDLFRWANENQGVLTLLVILITVPTLLVLLFRWFRSIRPSKEQKQTRIRREFEHADFLKKQIEENTNWDNRFREYGEFLLRDTEGKLPDSEEAHSNTITPHSIVSLIDIEKDHLEFTNGSFGIRSIKQIADSYYYCDDDEEEAIKVYAIFWLNYRDIELVRWETDSYWKWPQIFCRFKNKKQFPFSSSFYAKEKTGLPRPYFQFVCNLNDVRKKPCGL